MILAFDTSLTACSVALNHGNSITFRHQIGQRQQTQLILPMIDALLKDKMITLEHLSAIAYGCGPGSFTGIRVASSVAQGLAFACHKPIIQVSSLAVIAQTAYQHHGCKKVLIAIDAKLKQIYWACYQLNQQGVMTLAGKEALTTADKIDCPKETDWFAVGNGWTLYKAQLIERLGFSPLCYYETIEPEATALLPLAKLKFEKGETLTAHLALPQYL